MSHVHDPLCPVATVYDAMGDRPAPRATPPIRALTRQGYATMRAEYRSARRADLRWRPCPYAARNTRQAPPRHAARFIAALPMELVATFMAPFTVHGRLPRGPRAEGIYQRRLREQRRTSLTSNQIALAHGLRQMEAVRRAAA